MSQLTIATDILPTTLYSNFLQTRYDEQVGILTDITKFEREYKQDLIKKQLPSIHHDEKAVGQSSQNHFTMDVNSFNLGIYVKNDASKITSTPLKSITTPNSNNKKRKRRDSSALENPNPSPRIQIDLTHEEDSDTNEETTHERHQEMLTFINPVVNTQGKKLSINKKRKIIHNSST